jgi:KH-domain type I
LQDYPNYNFIGLIIGPRGMTQKQMERDTGAKISIRGRGSSTRGRMNSQPGDDDELHVLVTADTRAQLQKASALVEKLLTPIDETKNLHKQLQLRTLAQINGTLRDNMWGENTETAEYAANVRCAICNDPSHVTSDCTQRGMWVCFFFFSVRVVLLRDRLFNRDSPLPFCRVALSVFSPTRFSLSLLVSLSLSLSLVVCPRSCSPLVFLYFFQANPTWAVVPLPLLRRRWTTSTPSSSRPSVRLHPLHLHPHRCSLSSSRL